MTAETVAAFIFGFSCGISFVLVLYGLFSGD